MNIDTTDKVNDNWLHSMRRFEPKTTVDKFIQRLERLGEYPR